jgi:non-specific serine/threonine protein kinase
MLLERMDRRLALLRWDAPDLPPRQRTLRGAINWSYELLAPQEQAVFRRLAVFVGGFTLEVAEAILASEPYCVIDAVEGVSSLVDKSLVQAEDNGQRTR